MKARHDATRFGNADDFIRMTAGVCADCRQITHQPTWLLVRFWRCASSDIAGLCAGCRALNPNQNPALSGMLFSGNRLSLHYPPVTEPLNKVWAEHRLDILALLLAFTSGLTARGVGLPPLVGLLLIECVLERIDVGGGPILEEAVLEAVSEEPL